MFAPMRALGVIVLLAFAGCEAQTLTLLPEQSALKQDAAKPDTADDATPRPPSSDDGSCTESRDCDESWRPACDTVARRCVECMAPGHCDEPGETCDVEGRHCRIPCTEDGDCEGERPRCSDRGFCVECDDDQSCDSTRERPFCEYGAGECEECTANSHCPTDQPYCEEPGFHCEECLFDEHCAVGEHCDSSGSCVSERDR